MADEGTFLSANKAFCLGFNLKPEAVIGTHISELFSPRSASHASKAAKTVSNTARQRVDNFCNCWVGGDEGDVVWFAEKVDRFGHIYCEVCFPVSESSACCGT